MRADEERGGACFCTLVFALGNLTKVYGHFKKQNKKSLKIKFLSLIFFSSYGLYDAIKIMLQLFSLLKFEILVIEGLI